MSHFGCPLEIVKKKQNVRLFTALRTEERDYLLIFESKKMSLHTIKSGTIQEVENFPQVNKKKQKVKLFTHLEMKGRMLILSLYKKRTSLYKVKDGRIYKVENFLGIILPLYNLVLTFIIDIFRGKGITR